MNYIKMVPECPEYWENPKDVCAAAIRHGIFCYCTCLTDTNFGMRHCPFYKTPKQIEVEKAERKRKREEEKARVEKEEEERKKRCALNAGYACPQLIFKIPKQLFRQK